MGITSHSGKRNVSSPSKRVRMDRRLKNFFMEKGVQGRTEINLTSSVSISDSHHCSDSATVTLMTSSIVVLPSRTLRTPYSRIGR